MDMLKIKPTPSGKSWKQLIIDSDSHELLRQLSKESGISMTKLVSEMIIFCVNRVEVEADI